MKTLNTMMALSLLMICVGMAGLVWRLYEASNERDIALKSLAACQQENADLKGVGKVDENVEALVETIIREHEMARPCYPNCPKEVLNLTRYREACEAVPACEAKAILDEEAPR